MCVININLNTTVPNGTFITSAAGEYRLLPSGNWIPFSINLNTPATPDIFSLGNYELRVKVTNNLGQVSPWSNVSNFSVSTICGGNDIVITQDCNSDCGSGWEVIIFVPVGESRTLTIQKIGLATYAGNGFLNSLGCGEFDGVLLSNDTSNDILEYGPFTETTSFKFGLDAAQNSTGTAQSTLVVRTYNASGDNLAAEAYNRTHLLNNTGTAVINC
jgi:hypothetical protein